jgi:hypothetical protein
MATLIEPSPCKAHKLRGGIGKDETFMFHAHNVIHSKVFSLNSNFATTRAEMRNELKSNPLESLYVAQSLYAAYFLLTSAA